MKSQWNKYVCFAERNIIPVQYQNLEEIEYWKARLFSRLMVFMVPAGFLAYLAGFIMSVAGDIPVVAVADTIGYSLILIVFFTRKIPLAVKKIIILACFYSLAVILLIFIGSSGPGLLFLLAASVFSVLLFSSKVGFYTIIFNILIYCLLSIGLLFNIPDIPFFNDYYFGSWVAIGSSFLLINSFIVFSVAWLIDGLQKTIVKEKNLKEILDQESIKLEKAKEEAIKSEKMKSAFLANMSHEIRTPLNAIVGFANILLSESNPNEQKVYVDVINKSSRHLLDLINDIIHFSKINAEVITIENKQTNVFNFLHTMAAAMKAICPANLEFEYKFNLSGKEQLILFDDKKVTQILNNLITNAFKYTRQGVIEFSANISKEKSTIHFTVKDTGIGIPKEKQTEVFERFYQENSTSDGVGLGLSISNALAKALGGTITFESERDKGTVFHVSIPYKEVDTTSYAGIDHDSVNEQAQKDFKQNGSLHILIAEDIDENYELLKEILTRAENHVSRASNGKEAVEFVKNQNFGLVLMDIKMPEMDGYEATRLIRQFNTQIPIIAVTAYVFNSDKKKALKAGCNDFITKPVDFSNLFSVIKKYSTVGRN